MALKGHSFEINRTKILKLPKIMAGLGVERKAGQSAKGSLNEEEECLEVDV